MTTHAPMAAPRQPFAVLDSSRLQQLTSIKNRQNGITSSPLAKSPLSASSKPTIFSSGSSTKRKVQSSIYEDVDGENVDPSIFLSPTKRSKGNDSTPVKPAFHITTTPSFTFSRPSPSSMPPPSIASSLTPRNKANTSSPRAPLTAPAGRSPKSKSTLPASKLRRVSAPYTRIDPPSFNSASLLPMSLEAALKGTLSRDKPSQASTIKDTMPRNWFFDIHEDTPEEEASNLMEHSTLCLDLSSDDENTKRASADMGKENLPPPGYEAPTTTPRRDSAAVGLKSKIPQLRRKVLKQDEMDDGERSPLCSLEAEDFYPEGLHKGSIVVIPITPATEGSSRPRPYALPEKKLVEVEKHLGITKREEVFDVPCVSDKGDVEGEIIIFEDEQDENSASSPTAETKAVGEKRKRGVTPVEDSEN